VINSILFGGAGGYDALKRKLDSLEMDLGETCSGGCDHWEKTGKVARDSQNLSASTRSESVPA
jgi:hypothetical protein